MCVGIRLIAAQPGRRVDTCTGQKFNVNVRVMAQAETSGSVHLDVLVVGAGLSGVAAGHYLRTSCPSATFAIFEAHDTVGGTWDLFRYPGVRSDSDMHTLGYSFRPWEGAASIADGPSILRYIKETASAEGLDARIHFGHRVVAAELVERRQMLASAGRADRNGRDGRAHGGLPLRLQRVLPLRPRLPTRLRRMEDFTGTVVHPRRGPPTSTWHTSASPSSVAAPPR